MVIAETGVLTRGRDTLRMVEMEVPHPGANEILIKVSACGVCHTELDEIEGRTPPPRLPVVPGHQVVGRVAAAGPGAKRFHTGDRVGVAWIFSACGHCRFCRAGQENLCQEFKGTGRDADGGYAEFLKVHEAFAEPIPEPFSDLEAAPLLCAGAVGYRSLRLTRLRDGEPLALVGFGASAHLVLQMARHLYPASPLLVFARSAQEREFALGLGATWSGGHGEIPPQPPVAAIDTTPVWRPPLEALAVLAPGGRLVINAIRKEDQDKAALLEVDYPSHVWLEKEIKSVANVTRSDVSEFLQLAAEIPIRPEVQAVDFAQANRALTELKEGKIRGAKVLEMR